MSTTGSSTFQLRNDQDFTDVTAQKLSTSGNLSVGGKSYLNLDTTINNDLAVNGGNLSTTSQNFNLINENATTVHFAQDATVLHMGKRHDNQNIETRIQNNLRAANVLQSLGTASLEPIAAGDLVANTHYTNNLGNVAGTTAFFLPLATEGSNGDFITVLYITNPIGNGNDHTYKCTPAAGVGAAQYTPDSIITRVGGASASDIDRSVDAASDNTVTITGETDGDGGIGTFLKFVHNAESISGWSVEVMVLNQGNGSVSKNAATIFETT